MKLINGIQLVGKYQFAFGCAYLKIGIQSYCLAHAYTILKEMLRYVQSRFLGPPTRYVSPVWNCVPVFPYITVSVSYF
jgi:hypothetical protein